MEHCKDHEGFLTTQTEIKTDVKWIKGALIMQWGFVVTVVIGGIVLGLWMGNVFAK